MKTSSFGRWGPAAGVLAVGMLAFSLSLEGAAPSPQPSTLKVKSESPAAPALIEGSDALREAAPFKQNVPTRSGHATTAVNPDNRLPEGIKFGRMPAGDLPIMEPMVVDYRDDSGTRMRAAGTLVGPYRPNQGAVAAGGCSFDIQCNDCDPCTSDFCDIDVGDALGTGTCINTTLADGADGGCSDGLCCNGRETCQGGVCQAPGLGTGIFDPNVCEFPCSGGQFCNESSGLCRPACDGTNFCAVSGIACTSTNDCDLTNPDNYCKNCQDGTSCNGAETCVVNVCEPGTNPCGPGAICGEKDCSGAGTTICTSDSDCAAVQLGTCTKPGPICFPGRCCDNAPVLPACTKRKKSGGTCSGGANATGQCETSAQCDVCVGGVNITQPCTVNGDCPGSTCNTGGTCTVTASCDAVGGKWYATDDGQLPFSGGTVCPTPAQENPANDRTLCPKFSSGIAPLVDFDTETAFVVGFFSQGALCDHQDIGDDYRTENNSPIAMEMFRWIGGGGGRLLIEFYDEFGNFVEDVVTGGISGVNAVRSLNFLPPLTIPARGYWVVSVALNFAPNGQTFVTATDAVDEGINLASGAGSLWLDGGPSSVSLRECVGGSNDGAWCDPDDLGDSECVSGGGACQVRNNILSFEIEGQKVPAPSGACCNNGTGVCTAGVLPWVCVAQGNNYQGNDSTCPGTCGQGACCTAGTCSLNTLAGCPGGPPLDPNFKGFGTDCEPNCCTQSPSGGNNCGNVATIHNITVPNPGAPAVVKTITGNNVAATGPDTCLQGAWSVIGGTFTTVDPGWWEAFRINECAFVRVDFCCSDPVIEPAWALLWEGCPCDDAVFTAVDPNFPGEPANKRGSPFCDEDNLWNKYGPLKGGTCTGGSNVDKGCVVNGDCPSGNCSGGSNPGAICANNTQCRVCVGGGNAGNPCTTAGQCPGGSCPAGGTCTLATCAAGHTYYVPVYSVPQGAHGQYQMHITVDACPIAACCNGTACVETDQLGCAAIDGANYLAPPFRTTATTTCTASTCATGSCCYVPGQALCVDVISSQLATKTLCDPQNTDCTGPGVPAPCCTGNGTGTCGGASNGDYKGGARCNGCICQVGSPAASCNEDSDCGVNGPCNNPGGGPCSGQNLTQPSPCPLCDFQSSANCQLPFLGTSGWVLSDLCSGDCVSDPPASPNSAALARAADDFVASVGGTITSVCITGQYVDQLNGLADCYASGPPENFKVSIYGDLGGVPGAIIGGQRTTTVTRKTIANTSGGDNNIQYQLLLSSPIPISQGLTYWLEVVNDTDESTGLPGCDWGWKIANPLDTPDKGNDYYMQDYGLGYTVHDAQFGTDLAWCLTIANTVPPLEDRACCTCGGGVGSCAESGFEACVQQDGQWTFAELDCIGVNCRDVPDGPDNCSQKQVVTSDSDTPFNNFCTNTDGPAATGCGNEVSQNDLWYAYTAECAGEVVFETCDKTSEFDSVLTVYSDGTSTCPCPTDSSLEIACGESHGATGGFCVFFGLGARLTVPVEQGVCYTIRFGGYSGAKGEGVLHVTNPGCGGEDPPVTPVADLGGLKTRFISFSVPTPGPPVETALRIKLTSLHVVVPPYLTGTSTPFTAFNGSSVWVGPPGTFVESNSNPTQFRASQTTCTPHYRDWNTVGLLHVTGSHIVPSSTYHVENVAAACQGIESSPGCAFGQATVSGQLEIKTTRWGDVEVPYNPPSPSDQPDSGDISALVNKFRSALGAPIKARALLAGSNAFGEIPAAIITVDFGFNHVSACVDAFRGVGYPGKVGKCSNNNNACTAPSDCGGNACNLYCPP